MSCQDPILHFACKDLLPHNTTKVVTGLGYVFFCEVLCISLQDRNKNMIQGWGCSSHVQHWPSMFGNLSLISIRMKTTDNPMIFRNLEMFGEENSWICLSAVWQMFCYWGVHVAGRTQRRTIGALSGPWCGGESEDPEPILENDNEWRKQVTRRGDEGVRVGKPSVPKLEEGSAQFGFMQLCWNVGSKRPVPRCSEKGPILKWAGSPVSFQPLSAQWFSVSWDVALERKM